VAAHDTQHLFVTTPERVTLSLPVAGVGHRVLAWFVDASLLFLGWCTLYFAASLALDVLQWLRALEGLLRALLLAGAFSAQWAAWTACEVLMGGQTPGKRLLGIRVTRRDGGPVGFTESAVRNLLRVVDFLPLGYAGGLLAMLLGGEARRLGDLVAGTLVVQDGRVDLSGYLGDPAAAATGRPLSPAEWELLVHFRARRAWMDSPAREALAARLARHLLGPGGERVEDPGVAESALDALAGRDAP